MLLGYILATTIGHNGVIHKPQESSSILVGPSLFCENCYAVSNYGMNYIYHVLPTKTIRLPHNTSYFPLAVVILRTGTVLSIVDIGSSLEYCLNNNIVPPPPNCPQAEISKFYNFNGTITMFSLKTGSAFELGNDMSCSPTTSWTRPIDWTSVWGGADNNVESPLFYAYHRYVFLNNYPTRRHLTLFTLQIPRMHLFFLGRKNHACSKYRL